MPSHLCCVRLDAESGMIFQRFEEAEMATERRVARARTRVTSLAVFLVLGAQSPSMLEMPGANGLAGWLRVQPSTVPILGPNDVRISDMGPDGDRNFRAEVPATAYNATANEYFVVWQGEDDTPPLVEGEFEIFGQRIDAATGLPRGTNDFRISEMGPDGSTLFHGTTPAVTYNPVAHEYLVVWAGTDDTPPLTGNDVEIFGQRLDASTGVPLGANDFRISDMGPDGHVSFFGREPAVVYNAASNEYLVVWEGVDNTPPLVAGEIEIFGQRLSATGAEIGTNDFRISFAGPNGNNGFSARHPALAHNVAANQYLVVWEGEDDTAPLVVNEREIFSQRLSATGLPLEATDFRISDMGPDGSTAFGASNPAVAYDGTANEYLVVWEGEDDTAPLVENEVEIFGQRLSGNGSEIGSNDFRVSRMGPDGNVSFAAFFPAVAYNAVVDEYLVVWHADHDTLPLVPNEFEIFGQRLSGTGTAVGTDDFRISTMGPNGDTNFSASRAAVSPSTTTSQYVVVWMGDDGTPPLADNEVEIYGQRLSVGGPAAPPASPPTPTGLTAVVTGLNVVVRWNAAPGATSYRLRATGPGINFNQNMGDVTSAQGVGLPVGNYTVEVFALNAAGENPVPAVTNFTIGTPLPPSPTGVIPTVTGRDVSVRWTAAPGALSYRVRATRNGAPVFDANVGNTTSVFGLGIPPGRYVVEVFSVSAAGQNPVPGTTQFDVF
jgi:hypothetical protein